MPRISIIVNVYNGEKTLRETLDSVLAQTFSDWELIIWDDGSSDDSVAILSEYEDSRIRFFSTHRNQGLGPSRMAALEHAEGQWFAFLDQDDLWMPEKLEKQVQLTDTDPDVGFIYGRALKFYPNGTRIEYDHRHEYVPLPKGDIFERLFIDSCFIAISTVLFRRQAFDTLPTLPPEISNCPDYFLYLEYAKKYRVLAVQSVVCHYRIHAGNMTHTSGQEMQREILKLIEDWSGSLPPKLVAKRQEVHSTVLAVHQMSSVRSFGAGVKTLFNDGGLLFLLSRPFAKSFRSVRRRLTKPYWKRFNTALAGFFITLN